MAFPHLQDASRTVIQVKEGYSSEKTILKIVSDGCRHFPQSITASYLDSVSYGARTEAQRSV